MAHMTDSILLMKGFNVTKVMKNQYSIITITLTVAKKRRGSPLYGITYSPILMASLFALNPPIPPTVDRGVSDITMRGRETRGGGCLGNAGRL